VPRLSLDGWMVTVNSVPKKRVRMTTQYRNITSVMPFKRMKSL